MTKEQQLFEIYIFFNNIINVFTSLLKHLMHPCWINPRTPNFWMVGLVILVITAGNSTPKCLIYYLTMYQSLFSNKLVAVSIRYVWVFLTLLWGI